ncbi:multifunctional oxoglutarate decarboxylase/oxoglutarate dehydrogenase thiamine pyrophosphate-binding subunit/dihydrolipoyllysine-residue succinyltransferase subunit [Bryobacter aggregatus]|uniref:multifunctional oxoglutarate decarboxylase/oxoglutarate dehydrogenase thiamine pyrophosphate-binding subunit/dihydrolipoyllysine-residue succinyltransferase subunit n=1 Tax=Bryobacter aggregatus TaxID=360054 RepID=UPI0004E1593F|nr:multifunctional oxoglutarate decarboxylase/oxoglutarate dehydrogenase thiamine pyrophosphate-binding subunit/dihydrolipoyllysine-residue succinyltransferase subunit [Bryobacter aggregatus]
MSESINDWLAEELYQEYLNNRGAVDTAWKGVFDVDESAANGTPNGAAIPTPPPVTTTASAPAELAPPVKAPAVKAAPAAPATSSDLIARASAPPKELGPAEQLVPLRGTAARIAENMNLSLAVPTATSVRSIPVKVIDENRTLINQSRTMAGKSKISYTHIIAYAISKAVEKFPNLNSAYAESDGQPFRWVKQQVNLGLAIDVAGKDGQRSLVVPSIKNTGIMNFQQFLNGFDDLVKKGRNGKLGLADFQGTTISLTNPGTVGTLSSVPRLMPGQGAIIATGAIDYPAEYMGVRPETRSLLGLSKTMMMSCTYDHRVIQGAESGSFLAHLQDLLNGKHNFYEEIFAALKLPYRPVSWQADRAVAIPGVSSGKISSEVAKEAAVLQLIHAYRVRGHLISDLNPLGSEAQYHPELDPSTYGLTIWDLDREFITGNLGASTGLGDVPGVSTLRETLETLRRTYCNKVGVEYMHIQYPDQKAWLQQRLEPPSAHAPLDEATRRRILERLLQAEMFEQFLGTRFIGQKRFSLEGGESAIAMLDEIVERSANTNVHEVVVGMAHRGRLTVLANVIGKRMAQIFSEFEGNIDPNSTQGSGDVKYHLGASSVRTSSKGKEIVVTLAPNPSHLEAVDPVVEGIVRPKQERLGDTKRERVIPVLVHGDAAFAGQGVVMETFNLSQLEGYTTGGTVHLVINNQIGFTTNPQEARSSSYCTDIARMVQAPIFHVNGDDPEACFRVMQAAFDFRQEFKRDVVVDMVCYRRHGHNEGDDPSYTQPLMYRLIKNQPSVATQYSERLIRDGMLSAGELDSIKKRITAKMEEGFEASHTNAEKFETVEMTSYEQSALPSSNSGSTAIDRSTLERIIKGYVNLPEGFTVHPKLKSNTLDKRAEVLAGGPIDWATGEMLAFGSLVLEGTPVRLSGQDSPRGTFSQRHLELVDYETGKSYFPLQHLSPDQAKFDAVDSSLSEYAVMGFEFGYSVADPLTLVLWEAQFGDFVNGAQIMIDQFISSAEAKWGQPSGLVLLLPHGYEGQGPEHSSARIERFLQQCAEENMIVANCTTAANYFHLLRRQMNGGEDRRGLRKPLIVFTPKAHLRSLKAASHIEDFVQGSFREVIGDSNADAGSTITRVLLCSGKVYYDLVAAREERNADHVAIVRLEQLYPFPADQLSDMLQRYSPSAELIWVQEEPRNMGAWRFVQEQVSFVLNGSRRSVHYAGRPEAASPATGSSKQHSKELAELLDAAFSQTTQLRPRRVRLVARRKK